MGRDRFLDDGPLVEILDEGDYGEAPANRVDGLPFNQAPDVDLSAVQRDFENQLDDLLGRWFTVTAHQRDQILDQVRAAINNDDLAALAALNVSSAEQAQILTEAMTSTALTAAQHVVDEAARQGARIDPVATDTQRFALTSAALAALMAGVLANAAGREALRRWSPSATGDEVAAAVRSHLEDLSTSFVEQNLGGALHSALTAGRMETMLAVPSTAIYASEVMDANTCLAPTVLVTTRRGEVAAAEVSTTDELLTHAGRWVRPSQIAVTEVDEDLVVLGLDGERELLVTWDHPVLVVERGDLVWRQAGQLTVGTLMVGQASLQDGGELRVPDLVFGQAPYGVAAIGEVGGLPSVHVRAQRVPVASIGLNDEVGADEKVDDPATDLGLWLETQPSGFETDPDRALDAGLYSAGHVAPLRAESPLPGQRRNDPELDTAVVAGDQQRRASADLAAIGAGLGLAVTEHGATAAAGRVTTAGRSGASTRAVVVPIGLTHGNLELDTAVRTGLRHAVGGGTHPGTHLGIGVLTGAGAVDGAGLAPAGDLPPADLAESRRGAGAPSLDGGVLLATRPARADSHSAFTTRVVHDISVVEVTTVDRRPYRGYVYDFTVPGDETFWAEGVLVHNCKPCQRVDGRHIGNTDDPDIVAKVAAIYPNGGYVDCLGGVRCRGTTVAVFRPERVGTA